MSHFKRRLGLPQTVEGAAAHNEAVLYREVAVSLVSLPLTFSPSLLDFPGGSLRQRLQAFGLRGLQSGFAASRRGLSPEGRDADRHKVS